MSVKISPSILTADFLELEKDIKKLEAAGTDMLHLDVMDGIFVPNISFGVPVIKSVKKHTSLPLDVHLMIDRPHRYIKQFAEVSDILGFHYEAGSNVEETLKEIRNSGCRACLTIKPCTDPEEIFSYLPLCDMVLVTPLIFAMVALLDEACFSRPFRLFSVDAISRCKARYCSWLISVPLFISSSAFFLAALRASSLSAVSPTAFDSNSCFCFRSSVLPGSSFSSLSTFWSSVCVFLISLFVPWIALFSPFTSADFDGNAF